MTPTDRPQLKVGAPGGVLPPGDSVARGAARDEATGYDSLWWPDHLMGWFPQSLWTPDVGEIAAHQPNPHVFFDVVASMAVASMATEHVAIGTSVTDTIRRSPAVAAQSFLTLHHLNHGRTILGLGAGEGENIEPYGMDFSRPVSKLEEALAVIRLLWSNDEPVDHDGDHWVLRDAVLGLGPYEGTVPPIWLAAHGPRMLEICGRYGDGWLPINLSVQAWADGLRRIRGAAMAHGRDPDDIEPGLFAYCVVSETHERAHELMARPLVKAYALLLPAAAFERHGFGHPLGDGAYGLSEYVPSRFGREQALELVRAVPEVVVHDFMLHGTPDDLVARVREYEAVGLRHVVPWNVSFFGDWAELKPSFRLLGEFLEQVKDHD